MNARSYIKTNPINQQQKFKKEKETSTYNSRIIPIGTTSVFLLMLPIHFYLSQY